MKISVIIPAYNEEKTIAEIVRRVKKVRLSRGIRKEIIVVDDSSSDSTYKILSKIKGIKVFKHNVNRGKGRAVRTGLSKAIGDVIIIQDADLEYDPKYYPRLIKPIIDGDSDVVYGTRLRDYPIRIFGTNKTPLFSHYMGNKLLTLVTNILYGSKITDMETCYKILKKEVIKDMKLRANRFDFEPEITAKILKKGHKIHEVPIRVKPRGYNEGKKIGWKDGFGAVYALIKYRFMD